MAAGSGCQNCAQPMMAQECAVTPRSTLCPHRLEPWRQPGDHGSARADRALHLDRLIPSGGAFNIEKLNSFNGQYIRKLSDEELVERITPFLRREGLVTSALTAGQHGLLMRLAPLVKERLVVLADAPRLVREFFITPQVGSATLLPKGKESSAVRAALARVRADLANSPWSLEALESAVRALASETTLGKHLFMVVRVAITGSTVSLPLFETLHILGREVSLSRIDAALAALS